MRIQEARHLAFKHKLAALIVALAGISGIVAIVYYFYTVAIR